MNRHLCIKQVGVAYVTVVVKIELKELISQPGLAHDQSMVLSKLTPTLVRLIELTV